MKCFQANLEANDSTNIINAMKDEKYLSKDDVIQI